MTVLKTARIRSSLQKKGFVASEGDHTFFHYINGDGKKTAVMTKISHGKSEISDPLIGQMAKQVNLSKNQFMDLVNCPLSKEEYESILESKNLLQ